MDTNGTVLLCDPQGTILKVLQDGLGFAPPATLGRPLTLLVDRGSLGKALSFLTELQIQGRAINWELNVPIAGQVDTLYFAGRATPVNLLIAAARTRNELEVLVEHLGATSPPLADSPPPQSEQDSRLYDELSRLNNELVTLQRQLVSQNAALEALNQQKNRFLGMAAHDLRNPLNIILTYSEFLLDEAAAGLDAEHVDFLSIIQSSSRFMLQLVDELLDVATIEAGQLHLARQPTDLVDLVKRNVSLNRVLAAKRGIRLVVQAPERLPHMPLDRAKIDQVLNNLVSNAIKYSPSDSSVWVDVSRTPEAAIVSVRDQGPGIAPDQLDRLFNWFGRTTSKSASGEKSTGLGLAIAQRIVQGHGGRIWAESPGQPGQGSTFSLALPIPPPSEGDAV